MTLSKEDKETLKEVRDDLKEVLKEQTIIHTVLLGANGAEGLAEEVRVLAKGHGKLKRSFWTLVGILIGTGALGGGLFGLFNGG